MQKITISKENNNRLHKRIAKKCQTTKTELNTLLFALWLHKRMP